jgi:hypothetical protein
MGPHDRRRGAEALVESGRPGVGRLAPWASLLALALAGGIPFAAQRGEAAPAAAAGAAGSTAPPTFSEVARETGLDFVHFNGMSGEVYFVETMGAGVGLFDFDNDGDLDAYFPQGAMLGSGKTLADATFPPARTPRDRLYRNDLIVEEDGSRRLRFTDVTEASGIDARGYGIGVAAADYDNDGFVDLYVTEFGSNRLLRNDGDGTFTDVTERAGAGDPRWSASAAFVDYDRDGRLDLYVSNYVDYAVERNKICRGLAGVHDYCAPKEFRSLPDRLFRNRGDGTFEDVSRKAGIAATAEPGLGVVTADFDGDGWSDIFVANDGRPNLLWINRRDGTFENTALLAGAALDANGRPQAGMGVDAADFDGDGDEDLYVTHLGGETNTLYVNDREGMFADRTIASGMNAPTVRSTGFGAVWLDFDSDGRLDLIVASGAVYVISELVAEDDPYPLHERNLLFRGRGDGRWEEVSERAGPAFALSEVSRGVALGDVDNDGDVDVLMSNNSGPARLLLNEVGNRRHWLGLRLVEGDPPRDALGARVVVTPAGGAPLWRRSRSDGSYCSANDPRVLVGLGDASTASRVEVHWPDGAVETWSDLSADTWRTLRRGSGQAVESK